MKRSYSDAVKGNGGIQKPTSAIGDRPAVSPGQSTRDQLNSLTENLVSIQAAMAEPKVQKVPFTTTSDKEAKAKLKSLETTLASLPEDEVDLRTVITARIQEQKQLVMASVPTGARMDQARAALERARARKQDAEIAVDSATKLMETASSEVDALEAELRSLEQQTREPDKPMEVVQRLLAVMLAQLKDNPFIPPEQVNMATTHVQELIAGFENTVKAAKQEEERATKYCVRAGGSETVYYQAPRGGAPHYGAAPAGGTTQA